MVYKYYSKQELRSNCISETMRLVRLLTSVYYIDGRVIKPLSQLEIASILHLTQTQMSRISTGVCVPSSPTFFRLQQLYKSRLEDGLV